MTPQEFIKRWQESQAAERANYQLFLSELCDILEVPRPDPTRANDSENIYVFERNVHFQEDSGESSTGRIDLYKRGSFVLEAKQGSEAQTAEDEQAALLSSPNSKTTRKRGTAVRGTKSWDDAMVRARGQADRYARALPVEEGWPPFLIVVDVGHSIELYSEFSRSGKTYVPFPDPRSYRIPLADLENKDIRERLKQVWLDPLTLDPARRAAKVTRELAQRLGELAKLLEKAGHEPEDVAKFLMRSLFTMFAEDVELIPRGSFKDLLASLLTEPENFKPAVEDLWRTMNTGGFSPILRKQLLKFNGGLFAESEALPLTRPMLELLHEAAKSDWTDVEPAIFGTLLERALDPRERHKLGAHYTPRAYVERLVLPTVIEPLREDWQAAFAVAVTYAKQGDLEAARKTVRTFHETLCTTRVLDPACGSGNFLYVTMEQMKRLEGEVLIALRDFNDKQEIYAEYEVDPHQFLGIEINPRAAAIADLVLWIGYLQWHFRTRGKAELAEPIIKNYKNIECRDAVLAWDSKEPVLDNDGKPVTRWDGRTMKKHSVTGEDVPDDTARVVVERYINPRKAEWPEAEFIVGNPPFIGNKRMRELLGDEYVEVLRKARKNIPSSADYVMYWWGESLELISSNMLRHAGLITTNSITQSFNRQVLENGLANSSITYAIPDHPWIESNDGADVRVAMTVATHGKRQGLLLSIKSESGVVDGAYQVVFSKRQGMIHPDLTIGVRLADTVQLRANQGICVQGVVPIGKGFIVNDKTAVKLGRDKILGLNNHIRRYRNGRDLSQTSRDAWIIDLEGLSEEDVRARFPDVYQHLLETVKPEREQNRELYRRENWWKFGRKHTDLRNGLISLSRYIVTVKTSKHRLFLTLDGDVVPDSKLYVIMLDTAYSLGILSSYIHVQWATAVGGWLGVGNDPTYNNLDCFNKFPFPQLSEKSQQVISQLGGQLETHRKRQQSQYPKLKLTDIYNVLAKLRAGEVLTAKDKTIHEQGLVSVLKQIHDDLDAAVFDAYGWPTTLTDDEILERLVALNAERAEEERNGLIRWLRPDFQNPTGDGKRQTTLALADDEDEEEQPPKRSGKKSTAKKATASKAKAKKATKRDWPKGREAQVKAVLAELREFETAATAEELAKRFTRGPVELIDDLLEALTTLGQVRRTRGGKYNAI